jgi:hypothetical protein
VLTWYRLGQGVNGSMHSPWPSLHHSERQKRLPRQRLPQVMQDHLAIPDADGLPTVRIALGSTAWYDWLAGESNQAFAFASPQGSFTARRERQRNGWYWYAYRRQGARVRKLYLGKAADLTLERLTTVNGMLAQPPDAVGAAVGREKPAQLPSANAQRDSLLATKIHVPRSRARLVHRAHLRERLQEGMQQALTLLSAPAGFGKTTLLAEWLAASGTRGHLSYHPARVPQAVEARMTPVASEAEAIS